MKLRELLKEDCEILRLWRNESLSSLRTPYLITEGMQDDFYKNIISNRDSKIRYWGVCDNNELVAVVGLVPIQWENSIGEISLIVDPKKRGQGIGENAVDLLLNEAFNRLNLKTVFGECYMCTSAIDFWEKIIEKYEGYKVGLPNRKFWDGVYWGSLYFSIDRDKFNRRRDEN